MQSTSRSLKSSELGGGASVAGFQGGGHRGHEDEQSRTTADTDAARFGRLLAAAKVQAEQIGWVDVTQPDTDFTGIGIGTMVSWECDIYVPDIVQALAGADLDRQQAARPAPGTTRRGMDPARPHQSSANRVRTNALRTVDDNLAAHTVTVGEQHVAHLMPEVLRELDDLKRGGRNPEIREAGRRAERRLKGYPHQR